jgi:hypothetical protein
MKQKRILVVHSQLAQHGSERMMYEIIRILMNESVEVNVLTRPVGVRNQYYYHKLRELNVPILTRLITFRHFSYFTKHVRNSNGTVSSVVKSIYRCVANNLYFGLYERYDRIIVIGMETYCDSFAFMRGDKSKIRVHHVMHKFQQDRSYHREYDLDTLVVSDMRQHQEIRELLPNIALSLFPLPIDLRRHDTEEKKFPLRTEYGSHGPLRIGVVSRVKSDRPNEPIFRHFAALDAHCSAELHFFGSGNPDIYFKFFNEINLDRSKVVFHGHAESIVQSFRNFSIDVAWSVSMRESISYAAIEMISQGIPIFFINIGEKNLIKSKDLINFSDRESETVFFHKQLIKGKINLDYIRKDQFKFVEQSFSSEHLASILKDIYGL